MPRKGTKRLMWFGGVTLLCAAFVFAFLLTRERQTDISYGGKRLSQHLIAAHGLREPFLNDGASRQAIAALGTNCLPLLSQWLNTEAPPWRIKVGRRFWKSEIISSLFPPDDPRMIACDAIAQLGEAALPLALDLAAACTNSDARFANRAANILVAQSLTFEKIPVSLREALHPAIERSVASLEMQSLHDITIKYRAVMLRKALKRSELPILRLNDLSVDEQASTLRLLSRRGRMFDRALPLLLEHLQSTNSRIVENAAIALKNYGAQASNALPHLEKALQSPESSVKEAAANAISRITLLMKEGSSR